MSNKHGGERPGAGRPVGASAKHKGIAKRTQQILGDLYSRSDLRPPLEILWEAANGNMEDSDGEPISADLRIKAAIAAASYSHSRPAVDSDGNVPPQINFTVSFGDRIDEDTRMILEGKFRDVSEEVAREEEEALS